MTFVVNLNGVVYEKDMGPKTADLAKSYDGHQSRQDLRTVGEETTEEADSQ